MTALHVALLRRLAAGERIPPEWLTRAETPAGLDDLVSAGLAVWDAGAGVREAGHVVTPAGRAALLFYELAPLAVSQVRRWGGVLEHPAWSKLWPALGLPRPGELPDAWGGWAIEVNQVSWGHAASKPTWLYFVGVERATVQPLRGGKPTHAVTTSKRHGRTLLKLSSKAARLSPPAFAEWLVAVARGTHQGA